MPLRVNLENLTFFSLYRQGLLHTDHYGSAVQLCKQAGPVRAIPGVTAHLSLWARARNQKPILLDQALHTDRTLVRIPAMQSDLFIIPSEDYAAYHHVREALVPTDLYEYLENFGSANDDQEPHIATLASHVLDVLSARGACTIEELMDRIPELGKRIPDAPGKKELGTSRLGDRLVPAMCARGILVRADIQGSWRSDHYRFAALSSWLPAVSLDAISSEEAIATIILRYLRAFGPATVGDIVHWIGAVRRGEIVSALYRLGTKVSRLELRDYPGEYYVLTEDIGMLLNPPRPRQITNLLSPRDSYMMAYRDNARFIDRDNLDRVYDWTGDSTGVVLYEGRAVGIWWQRDRYDRVVIRTFEVMTPTQLALIAEEARLMGQFLGQQPFSIDIDYIEEPEKARGA